MRDTLIRTGVATFSGLFAVSFLAFVPGTAATAADSAYIKRDESVTLLATVDDDDDEREKFTPFSVSRASAPSRASRVACVAGQPGRDCEQEVAQHPGQDQQPGHCGEPGPGQVAFRPDA